MERENEKEIEFHHQLCNHAAFKAMDIVRTIRLQLPHKHVVCSKLIRCGGDDKANTEKGTDHKISYDL